MHIRDMENFQSFSTWCFGSRERRGLGLCEPACQVERRGRREGTVAEEVMAYHLQRMVVSLEEFVELQRGYEHLSIVASCICVCDDLSDHTTLCESAIRVFAGRRKCVFVAQCHS